MEVVYENTHVIIVSKRSGEIVQGDKTGDTPLSETVKAYLKTKYDKPGNVFLGVVHRLDRPVSGLVVFARTSKALARLNKMFRDGEVHKTYWAIVQQRPAVREARLTGWIVRNERQNKSYVYDHEVPGSKRCELHYSAGEFDGEYTSVDIKLITGRSPQIRAQFSHAGHPLYGDVKYGGQKSSNGLGLISVYLAFNHPVSGERMEFSL